MNKILLTAYTIYKALTGMFDVSGDEIIKPKGFNTSQGKNYEITRLITVRDSITKGRYISVKPSELEIEAGRYMLVEGIGADSQSAVIDALANGILRDEGYLVYSFTDMKNEKVNYDFIATQTKGLVKSYDVKMIRKKLGNQSNFYQTLVRMKAGRRIQKR